MSSRGDGAASDSHHNAIGSLLEWMVLYVKHKDVIARKLQDVKRDEQHNTAIFSFKDGITRGYALDRLSTPTISNAKQEKTLIVTSHTKENVDFLLHHWKEFAAHPQLTIIFVNLSKNEKWLLHPHTHAQIAESKVEAGIRSLASGVAYC